MGRKIARPYDISAEIYNGGYIEMYQDADARKMYLKGWALSQRDDATVDMTDHSLAMYHGYMDYALDLSRGHAMFCKNCSHGN